MYTAEIINRPEMFQFPLSWKVKHIKNGWIEKSILMNYKKYN